MYNLFVSEAPTLGEASPGRSSCRDAFVKIPTMPYRTLRRAGRSGCRRVEEAAFDLAYDAVNKEDRNLACSATGQAPGAGQNRI